MYPLDDSFWFHLRMGSQVYEQGRRDSVDKLSYSPEGRNISTYPPLLHYTFGYLCKLLKILKLKVYPYKLAAQLGLIIIFIVSISVALFFHHNFLCSLLLFFSTPILFLRILYLGFRGEILCLIWFSPWVASMVLGHEGWELMAGPFFLLMIFSSRTALASLEAYCCLLPFLLLLDSTSYLTFFSMATAVLIYIVYCLNKGWKLYLPLVTAILNIFVESHRQRCRYPIIYRNRLITEEEKPATKKCLFFLFPSLLLVLIGMMVVPLQFLETNTSLLFFFGYFLVLSLLSKRYLIYLAILLNILLLHFASFFQVQILAVMVPPFFLLLLVIAINGGLIALLFRNHNKRNVRTGIYQALDWIANYSKFYEKSPFILSWWNHGHIISGYRGYRNFWDSYFPDTETFLRKEQIFDEIIAGTQNGLDFCKTHQLKLCILEEFRRKHLSSQHQILWEPNGISVVLLYPSRKANIKTIITTKEKGFDDEQ